MAFLANFENFPILRHSTGTSGRYTMFVGIVCKEPDHLAVKAVLDSFSPTGNEGVHVQEQRSDGCIQLAYTTPGHGHGAYFEERARAVPGVIGIVRK